MDRRAFLGALGLLAAPRAAEAQPSARVPRIGWLPVNLASAPHNLEAFRQGMRDLGYIEGRNLVIEYRSAEGKSERLPMLAAELVALNPEVILSAAGTLAAQAAKRATTTLPIVFVNVGDPVASGLVTSFARPSGNATGLSLLFPELVAKGLEQLKLAFPAVSPSRSPLPARRRSRAFTEGHPAKCRSRGARVGVAPSGH